MDRLTRWIDDQKDIAIESKDATKDECLKRLAEYEDIGVSPSDLSAMLDDYGRMSDRMQEIDDAEEQGRLYEFPIAIGEHMWCLPDENTTLKEVTEMEVTSLEHSVGGDYVHLETIHMRYPVCFNLKYIGKMAFFSRAEAEAKLKEMEEDNAD